MRNTIRLMVALAILVAACGDDALGGSGGSGAAGTAGTSGMGGAGGMATSLCSDSPDGASLGIVAVPSSLGSSFTTNFCKAISLTAPNGGNVWIVGQRNVTDEQVLRARNILRFYLTDVPGTEFGANKAGVFDAMANRMAVLTMFNGRDDGANPAANASYDRPTQSLFAGETFIEGSAIYLSGGNEMDARDAAFEEILHFVHDNGIGVDAVSGNQGSPGALRDTFQAEIRAATNAAMAATPAIWPRDNTFGSWISELTAENSLTQEYLAGVNDAYWGLTAGDAGSGPHVSTTRAQLEMQDPTGATLLEKFLPAYLSYDARIDPSFSGTFSMMFNASQRYTNKSRYLLNARLLGTNASGLLGNDQNNRLQGNAGNNVLDGGPGTDTAVFQGARADYTTMVNGSDVVVTDSMTSRDGEDTLRNIEMVQFSDTTVAIGDL